MRVSTRFAVFAFLVCCLTVPPSIADDNPWAHLEGAKCEPLNGGWSPSGVPLPAIVVCQISDGGTPVETSMTRPTPMILPTLDSLLSLLTLLVTARHDASQQPHDAVVPTPTP